MDNLKRRNAAARNGLLCWLFDQHHAGIQYSENLGVLSTKYGIAGGGYRFTDTEIDRAADYLAGNGFVDKGCEQDLTPGRATLRITGRGIDCVEQCGGDIAAYRQRAQSVGGSSINIGSITSSGALAVGNQGDTTQTVTTDTGPAIIELARAMLRELPTLQLEPGKEAAIRAELVEAEHGAADEDSGPGPFERAIGHLVSAGTPVVAAMFASLASSCFGIPS